MAFIPQYTFISGYVTNDNLVILMSALCLLAFLNLLNPSRRAIMWRVAGTGVLLALALYTKLSLLFVVPLGMLCLLLRLVHHRSVRQWLLESSVLVGVAILPFLLGLLVLPGMREQVAYAYASLQARPEFMSLEYLAGLWPQTYTSFWGRFGWMNVGTPRWIADTMNARHPRWPDRFSGPAGARQAAGPEPIAQAIVGIALGDVRTCRDWIHPIQSVCAPASRAFAVCRASGACHTRGTGVPAFWQAGVYPVVGTSIVLLTFVANLVCLFGALLPAYAFPV